MIDQWAKLIQCDGTLRAMVSVSAGLAEDANDEELAVMNAAADDAISALKAAHDSVISARGRRLAREQEGEG
ncbi:MAG TPA: hypothetical protein DCY40_05965 [Actinobacteria bacterium]|nr:hypothetical protein [Actinomycetota bacterium]